VALAILYGLGLVLFLLVIAILVQPATSSPDAAPDAGQLLLLIFLIAILVNTPSLGMFTYVILGVLAMVMLPILIAMVFTVWVGTRPSAAHALPTTDIGSG